MKTCSMLTICKKNNISYEPLLWTFQGFGYSRFEEVKCVTELRKKNQTSKVSLCGKPTGSKNIKRRISKY